jgi:hypothetical protein
MAIANKIHRFYRLFIDGFYYQEGQESHCPQLQWPKQLI